MTMDTGYPGGCKDEFAELCALSTTGELSAEELATLKEHVAGCAQCAALMHEYDSLAHVGMATLAANLDPDTEIEMSFGYDEAKAVTRFAAAFEAQRSPLHMQLVRGRWRTALLAMAASLLVFCIGGGAFELGRRMSVAPLPSVPVAVVQSHVVADGQSAKLKMELEAAQDALKAANEKSDDMQKQLADLSDAKTALMTQIAEAAKRDSAASNSLVVVTRQRDDLQQQLEEASKSLVLVRDELNHARQDRQGALYRVATLESEIQGLHTQLASTSDTAGNTDKFLAADRDIRELMGARQLYIADVFDVQRNGDRSKPFGRVFYTKGKSLIFYAFDLEKQPGYREAKTFQAWGKPDSLSARPISLGVFYMDNEQNRRWVVKSDNAEVLAQINSVFVTVEPNGGSRKPTGKPFLEAYLHTLPPNHP